MSDMDLFASFGSIEATTQSAKKAKVTKTDVSPKFNPALYFADVQSFADAAYKKHAPNPAFWSRDNLSTFPNMAWLSTVDCVLYAPSSNDPVQQKAELDKLYDMLESTASYVTDEFSPCFPKGFREPLIGLDYEATGLDTRVIYDQTGVIDPLVEIVGVCLATTQNVGYYLPVMHTGDDGVLNWNLDVMRVFMTRINETFLTAVWNGQYDRELQSLHGIGNRPYPYFIDGQLLDFIYDVNVKTHGLKACSERHLGRKMLEISDLLGAASGVGKGKKKMDYVHFHSLPATSAFVYAASDAINTLSLIMFYCSQPDMNNPLKSQVLPVKIDHKMQDVLRNMYRNGFPVDFEYYYYTSLTLQKRITMLEDAMITLVGWNFKFGQNDLNTVLFKQFAIPPLPEMEANDKGLYGTDEDTLNALYDKYPDIEILNMIVSYRKLTGVYSKIHLKALVNSYSDYLMPNTRLQQQYSQTVIPTGRLSSSSSKGVERVTTKVSKTGAIGYKYVAGSGDAGMNTQGVNNSYGDTLKVRRIKKISPDAGFDVNNLYDDKTREDFYKALSSI